MAEIAQCHYGHCAQQGTAMPCAREQPAQSAGVSVLMTPGGRGIGAARVLAWSSARLTVTSLRSMSSAGENLSRISHAYVQPGVEFVHG